MIGTKNNSPMDVELNSISTKNTRPRAGQYKNNSPKDGESNSTHRNNSPKGWTVLK